MSKSDKFMKSLVKTMPFMLLFIASAMGADPSSFSRRSITLNFDWDDNLVYMLTKIQLFRKDDPRYSNLEPIKRLSTADFAIAREHLGKAGEWEAYEVRTAAGQNSFEFFGSPGQGKNYFLEDLKATVAAGGGWKAPAWDAFVYGLSTQESANKVAIITARSHSAKDIFEAFQWLQSEGYIRYIPPLKNLQGVGGTLNPSAEKAKIMLRQLDRLESKKVGSAWKQVTAPNGLEKAQMHIWTFSDDDWGNFATARDTISKEVAAGRYQNTKIMLFYTGLNHPTEKPHGIVLTSDGTSRNLSGDEEQRIAHEIHMRAFPCDHYVKAAH